MPQIPAWIKNELANSEMDPGEGADDTSDHSDEDGMGHVVMEASIASIQINKDFKHG